MHYIGVGDESLDS